MGEKHVLFLWNRRESQDNLSPRILFVGWFLVLVSIVGSLRDREVACSASDHQGSNFESCVWRTVSSQSSHHPQEVLLAQFSLYVHKGGLKPDSFHFFSLSLFWWMTNSQRLIIIWQWRHWSQDHDDDVTDHMTWVSCDNWRQVLRWDLDIGPMSVHCCPSETCLQH